MKSQSVEPENLSQKHGLLASRDQNTTLAVQYRLAWLRANRWNFVTAFFILAFISLGIGHWTLSDLKKQAMLNTPAKQGQAYVISKSANTFGTKAPVSYYVVNFRLNGKQITATTGAAAKWMKTPIDTTVPVTYHVGENGEVLISDWQPAPAK